MKKVALFLFAAFIVGSIVNPVLRADMTETKVKAGVSQHADHAAEAAKKAEAKAAEKAKREKAKAEKKAKKAKEKAEREARKAKKRAEKEAEKLKKAAQ